jgi:hypothetical protein
VSSKGWFGVDLDGTLAHYDGWKGIEHIGEPIAPMVEIVKRHLLAGDEVRIFTARVWPLGTNGVIDIARHNESKMAKHHIERWLYQHLGVILPITCVKDYGMIKLYDDRAIEITANTGRHVCLRSTRLSSKPRVCSAIPRKRKQI